MTPEIPPGLLGEPSLAKQEKAWALRAARIQTALQVQSTGSLASVYWQQHDGRAFLKWHGHGPPALVLEGGGKGKAAVGTCGLESSKAPARPQSS